MECQFRRVQELATETVEIRASVHAIARDWMSDGCEMNPDLMRSPCFQ